MALMGATVLEVRTTGSQANGGGFYNRVPGTSVDYSQQDTAQLTLTDLATNVAGTGLSSATGGFTTEMRGNLIQISGGTLTAGWYEIMGYTDTNTVTIDRSAGSSKTGGTGNVGGAFLLGGALDSDFSAMLVDGNKVHVASGTYTLGESCAGTTGGTAAPIIWEGYKTVRGDAPTGADRPTIACGDYIFTTGGYCQSRNLIFTGTGTSVATIGTVSGMYNCKVTNSSATADRAAITAGGENTFIASCEVICTNGRGIYTGSGVRVINCYIHDSSVGIYDAGTYTTILNNVIDTCSSVGIQWTTSNGHMICGNTIYNCATGIYGTTGSLITLINNIITACTTYGIRLTSGGYDLVGLLDYNCFYNPAGTDRLNVTAGPHDVDANPLLTDPANGDFTLDTSSPCFNSGITLDTTVGL